ncbi:MAG: aminoglycoside phosphotransferase [Hyphomicrobiales bacterium]|nr:MAG: aminoglycoside phosphotransferase [Hyphomicrobiales bacterium]
MTTEWTGAAAPQGDPAPSHIVADQDATFGFLADPATHGIDEAVIRVDTAISAVFLAGPLAYKVKRAVRFPYLDFGDLDHRRELCEREIERNRPNAPSIYQGVVAITREADGRLELDGAGETIEYAVRMRRFDPAQTLDRIAGNGPFDAAMIDALAAMMASAHEAAGPREAESWIADLATYIEQNQTAFLEWPDLFPFERVHALTEQCRETLSRLTPLLTQRGRMNHIRLCHGDAHLRNIVLDEGAPVLFDAIEFDDGIATGDVLYDLGFLIMDLWERGDRAAANRLMVRYLALTHQADHLEGIAALAFFMAIRAAIRAKVTAARLPFAGDAERKAVIADALRYFTTAEKCVEPTAPALIAIGGLSGTGKSTLAMAIAPDLGRAPGAVVLRTDVERKALFGVAETDPLPAEAYAREISDEVYHRLMIQARTALAAGQSVIIDAVFADPEERIAVARIAGAVEAPFAGLWLTAPAGVLEERVGGRTGDASDAGVIVVRQQLGYDIGALDWAEIDASGSSADTAESARAALGSLLAPGSA